jgi:exopolyphosphatase/guanosine-5'-triphosphate,3'-diphosphate pyrophosphatase
MILAAIDVGSTATRLLISSVTQAAGGEPEFNQIVYVRLPLRLGEDAFLHQAISLRRVDKLCHFLEAFNNLMRAYQAEDCIACATSPLRESRNAAEIVERVERRSGIRLEIVSGQREAEIISSSHLENRELFSKNHIFIDVGGGSTEVTVSLNGQGVTSRSFPLGTLRLLNHLVPPSDWDEMKTFLKAQAGRYASIAAIGSGGNIRKIHSLFKRSALQPLSREEISGYYKVLKAYSLTDRIAKLKLKPERADVILPATKVYLSAMTWAGASTIYVPRVSLRDGLLNILHQRRIAGALPNPTLAPPIQETGRTIQ